MGRCEHIIAIAGATDQRHTKQTDLHCSFNMGRMRVRRLPGETFELLLNLTNRHIHAQLVDRAGGRVILGVHSNQPDLRKAIAGPDAPRGNFATASVAAARLVGDAFGTHASSKGISAVYWARPGKYHGKIKAFIDAVREHGIETKKAPPKKMPTAPATDN